MQINIHSKELQAAIDRVLPAIDKKIGLHPYLHIYLEADKNGNLKVWAADPEQYAEVSLKYATVSGEGVFGIDIIDYKFIKKLDGQLSIKITEDESNKVQIQRGKKILNLISKTDDIPNVPKLNAKTQPALVFSESWLWETVTNLEKFIMENKNGSHSTNSAAYLHFNLKDMRVEASDLYRLSMRTLSEDMIADNKSDNILLRSSAIPVLKKMLDKKSDRQIAVLMDSECIKICGEDFAYLTYRPKERYADQSAGYLEYNNMNKILPSSHNREFTPQKSDMLDILKYDCELYKTAPSYKKTPLILSFKGNKASAFIHTERCESFDTIETTQCDCGDDFTIAFDPNYLRDAFDLVDSDYPICELNERYNAMLVRGCEYTLLVLPIRLTDEDSSTVARLNKYMHAA